MPESAVQTPEARAGQAAEQTLTTKDQAAPASTPGAAEAERQRALREAFRPGHEASAGPAHEARLREQFGQSQAAGAEQDPAAQQRALRESFSDQAARPGKTPEQLRQAFRDREKPAPKQDRGRDSRRTKQDRSCDSDQGRER